MLGGKLTLKDAELGEVIYSVKARDSFNDLKLYIVAGNEGGSKAWSDRLNLFDYQINPETGLRENPYAMIDSDTRRLDIKKTNKYKSNITNRDFCIKVAGLIRYMQIAGKQQYNQQVTDNHFSATRDVEIREPESGKKIGDISYNTGLITALSCENKYLKLDLHYETDEFLNDSLFKELKEKDKWGRVLSETPISIVGFKLNTDVLGFEYVPEVEKEAVQAFGMYETIEDVIANNPDKNTKWILDRDYHIVTDETLESVIKMFMDHEGMIAFDTETSGLRMNFKSRTNEADQLVGCVLSRCSGEGYYFPLQHKLFPNLCDGDHFYFMDRYMRPILENKKIICHNVKFDWKVAHIYDINVNCVYDTMLALGVTKRYEESTYEIGLKALAKNIFGLDMFELSDFVMGGSFGDSEIAFWDLPYELVRQYAPADTDMTYALYEFIEKEDILNKYDAKKIFDMEITFAKAVAYSEFYGYHIAVDKIPELQDKILGSMEECKKKMFEMAGKEFNPNSPLQLVTVIYEELYPDLKKELGDKKPSTDKEMLKTLAGKTDAEGNPKYPFVAILKEYRDNEGIYKNFLKKLPEFATSDGYIFPDVLQIGTTTGRVSVKNPNYQSYNDTVKHYVIPRQDFMHFDSDFAQIEQRVLTSYACIMFPYSEPLALLKDFDDPDMDYHQYQAARMFNVPYAAVSKGMRQQSKGINFGLPYGMGDESLGTRIFGERNKENTLKAADLRKKFFQGQELIEQFFEKVRGEGVKQGFTRTQWGRRRYYHKGVFSVNEIRRQAGNHVIQGCLGGDTRIQTKELGIVKIKDIAGYSLNVWNGEKWTYGDITYSGKKQKCIVHFSGGQSIVCSPKHKFLVKSHKGNERFVECKDLIGSITGRNPHRVVITREYEPSGHVYQSDRIYDSIVHNANNYYLDDIKDSFDIGVFLGRLASDGTFSVRENGGSTITHFVAEHESNILPELRHCMREFGFVENEGAVREGRTEKMTQVSVTSKSLTKEITDLDIKHKVHDNIFRDTEVLRGFLRGFYDGDGGVSGKTITLVFGTQYDFEPMCLDLQKALLFFGIRSRYRKYDDRYVLAIKTNDNQKFLDIIGFMNKDKQEKGESLVCKTDEHIFGPCLIVESVEITEEHIDMYDVCNTEDGYYVADGVITHNTAADLYKQAVNNMFERVCKEGWLGKVLFNGFIHDEMLIEVHKSINPYYFFKTWRNEFEVKPERYCRLFAGAGVGYCWYDAKKLDLPPLYIQEIIDKYEEDMDWNENIDEFFADVKKGFKEHKINRVKSYIFDEKSQGEIIKPAIGALLADQLGDMVSELQKDPERLGKLNDTLSSPIPLEGKANIKNLQDQLKLYCFYHNLDYSQIDIKSLDDMPTQAETPKRSVMFGEDEDYVDEEVSEVDPELLLKATLGLYGYYIDYANKTLYMVEMLYKHGNGFIQASRMLIDKSIFTQEGEYKIVYYPTIKGENPQRAEIPGYKVTKEGLESFIMLYTAWRNAGIGIIN